MRLLVTGASGFLGWTLARLAAREHRVFGAFHAHPVEIPGVTTTCLDLCDYAALKEAFSAIKPDAIIHTAALGAPNACQEDPGLARRINVEASLNLAGLAADHGVAFAFTSTDLVFDGLHPPYTEDSPVSPVSRYAETKVLAEEGILARHPQAGVFRLPLMFGPPSPWSQNFAQSFLRDLRAGKELKLFTDEKRTPVSSLAAATGLLRFTGRHAGRLHLGGRESVSRYDLGRRMAEVLSIAHARLTPIRQRDLPMAAPRPPDVSLDSARAYQLGYDPPPLDEDLQALAEVPGRSAE